MNPATTMMLLGMITEFENRVALIFWRTTHVVSIYVHTHTHTHTQHTKYKYKYIHIYIYIYTHTQCIHKIILRIDSIIIFIQYYFQIKWVVCLTIHTVWPKQKWHVSMTLQAVFTLSNVRNWKGICTILLWTFSTHTRVKKWWFSSWVGHLFHMSDISA